VSHDEWRGNAKGVCKIVITWHGFGYSLMSSLKKLTNIVTLNIVPPGKLSMLSDELRFKKCAVVSARLQASSPPWDSTSIRYLSGRADHSETFKLPSTKFTVSLLKCRVLNLLDPRPCRYSSPQVLHGLPL
jgi:hypothetical protein